MFSCSKNSISSRDRAQIHDELVEESFISHLILQPEANQSNYYQNVIKHLNIIIKTMYHIIEKMIKYIHNNFHGTFIMLRLLFQRYQIKLQSTV